ncbi:MAG: hypothetical protein ACI9TH_000996 [Kiritimatiellia bacterium]|jgi:hypothetical protein
MAASLALVFAVPAQAGFGFFGDSGSFIILDFGNGNEYFSLGPSASPNEAFNGKRLNENNIVGQKPFIRGVDKLILNGFENNTFENAFDNVLTAHLSYRMYKEGDTPGDFLTLDFNQFSNLVNPGDERHELTNAGVSLLNYADTTGTYFLEAYVWAEIDYSSDPDLLPNNDIIWAGPSDTIYQSTSGVAPIGSFTAKFVVEYIPEPNTAALIGIGVLLLRTVRKKIKPVA